MRVMVMPTVVGAFGTVSKSLEKEWTNRKSERIKINMTTTLLRSARVLRRIQAIRGDLLSLKFQWKTTSQDLQKKTCMEYNGYRRRKWTRRHELKSLTRLIAFHLALIPLGKVWIQLFSLQLWVNSRTD